jgi:hypothetical protein
MHEALAGANGMSSIILAGAHAVALADQVFSTTFKSVIAD